MWIFMLDGYSIGIYDGNDYFEGISSIYQKYKTADAKCSTALTFLNSIALAVPTADDLFKELTDANMRVDDAIIVYYNKIEQILTLQSAIDARDILQKKYIDTLAPVMNIDDLQNIIDIRDSYLKQYIKYCIKDTEARNIATRFKRLYDEIYEEFAPIKQHYIKMIKLDKT
jgi:hypothetical protein